MKYGGLFFAFFLVGVSANTGLNVVDTARKMGIVSFLFALEETNNVDLVTDTQNITVFIPTNDAFKSVDDATRDFWRKNPTYYYNLMRFHVVKGKFFKHDLVDEEVFSTFGANWTSRFVDYSNFTKKGQVYDGSSIRQYDINCSNGVIHLIDQVAAHPQNQNLMQIIQNRTDLTMILAAINLIPNITGTLNGMTPVTFLAPSNDAISKLPADQWNKTLKDTEKLKEILQYHVLDDGTWFSRGLANVTVHTLNKNGNVNVTINDNGVYFNKARTTAADLAATNGVVHVIDTVLTLPPFKHIAV